MPRMTRKDVIVQRFRLHLESLGLTAATINHRLAAVRRPLLKHLKERGKTAVLFDILTGLQGSELLALKWSDADFENLELHVTRSIALQRVGPCKTEASQKPVPLDSELAEVLLIWRRRSAYLTDGDWIFASPASNGALPYWSFSIFRVYIRPALKAAKITGK